MNVIALYLPQYYPVPENDKWYGKGFTEWINVAKAKPLFKGHYQPHIPADLGFYDLRLPQIRHEQEKLAREYGVDGFCYYHYWFGNRRQLLEKPLQDKLADKSSTLPFCLNWANESWKKKMWSNNAADDKMLMEQVYGGKQDAIDHFYSLLPAFSDERYIRVNGRLLFEIDYPEDTEPVKYVMEIWRELAVKEGIGDFLFLGHLGNYKDKREIRKNGIHSFRGDIYDMVVDCTLFNIMHLNSLKNKAIIKLKTKIGLPAVFEYKDAMEVGITELDKEENIIPEIFPNWDHSPRSTGRRPIYVNSTPVLWRQFFDNAINAVKDKPEEKQLVFIRAWNEWGEGNYLEPDIQYGRAYLEAIRDGKREHR